MITKTTGNGCVTQYPSMAAALRANDPFQTWERHTCRPAPGVCALELDFGAPPQCSSGEDTQLFQYSH